MPLLLSLFLTFAKIGLFTFGGGYAMIAMIESICVDRKKWITHDEMMNVTVIAESTPGPIAINCATFVGFRQAGLIGATVATVGIILPPFLLILLISGLVDNFLEIAVVASAFKGIKIAVGVLILDAGISMIKKMKKKVFPIAVASASCLLMLLCSLLAIRISSLTLMLTAGVISLLIFSFREAQKRKEGEK